MTMEKDGTQQTETLTSNAAGSRRGLSSTDKPAKKPPGEIDPSEYEEKEEEEANNTDDEELHLPDTSDYTLSQRNTLFEKGLAFEKKGKPDTALQCYLACMKGLKSKTRFALLPECLRNIADIYQSTGEFEKAIHFAQAEKLFYETALVETQEIQKKMEEVAGNLNIDSNALQDINDLNIQALRAEEYEHLARLCTDNNQALLALEYAGKCAKIRQEVYGSSHAKTRETLDFFASLYAEVGREQYSDSINIMADSLEGENNTDGAIGAVPEIIMSGGESGEPVSILRNRSSNLKTEKEENTEEKEKKQVRFHESVDDSIRRKRKGIARNVLIMLTLIVVAIIGYFLA